jgi:hypothetical protein
MISSEDEFGAVGYLAPRSPDGHKSLARQFSVNDSGIVDLHGSRYNSRLGLAIPNHGYGDWDENSDPRTPTSTHAFFQRTNSHPPPGSPWTNQQQHPLFLQAPEKYMKVPDYEELPNSTRHPDDPDVYTPIDEGSVCVSTEKKPQNGMITKGKQQPQVFVSANGRHSRLRTNPLYDQSVGPFVLPHYPPRKDGPCVQGSCCLQTFAFLFALVALVLVLWSVLAGRYGGSEEYQDLLKDIEGFRSNLSKLYQMVQNSESLSINDLNPIVQLLHNSSKMQEILNDLEVKINFLKSQENCANETFENLKQLSIGARKQMEMRGLANMSACSHRRKSYGRSSSFDHSITDPLDLSSVLVLGVLCTTKGGTEALLVDQSSDNNSNYTCICHGKRGLADQRYCTIHYWTCPILS